MWKLVPKPEGKSVIGTRWVYINKLDEEGIVTMNSKNEFKETKCDVIIMATGFSILNSATKSLSMVGRSGKKLQDQWMQTETPRAYLGITTVSACKGGVSL